MEGSRFRVIWGFTKYLLTGNEEKHNRAEDVYPVSTKQFSYKVYE
jgi:hypothetical protein